MRQRAANCSGNRDSLSGKSLVRCLADTSEPPIHDGKSKQEEDLPLTLEKMPLIRP